MGTTEVASPRSTAPGWEKWHDWNRACMAPVTTWMCRAIEATPGHEVLDLACGTGLPALELAERVQPGGTVVATDLAADMVAATSRRARAAGLDNLSAREMDMHAPGFAAGSFDAVTLAFALMFSPDPINVMTGVRRLLRPGGRVAVAVWGPPADNPFFTTLFGAIGQVVGGPPPDPTAPGPFRLSPPGELEQVLRAAELVDVVVAPVPMAFEFPSVDAHWECCCDMAAPLERATRTLPAPEVARLRGLLADRLAPYIDAAGRVRLGGTPLCAVGRVPAPTA